MENKRNLNGVADKPLWQSSITDALRYKLDVFIFYIKITYINFFNMFLQFNKLKFKLKIFMNTSNKINLESCEKINKQIIIINNT